MAISTNSPDKTTTEHQTPTQQPAPDNPTPSKSDLPPSSTIPANATIGAINPNSGLNNLQPTSLLPPPPPPQIQFSSVHPSFRPTTLPMPHPSASQFSPIPNSSFQNHGVQPPGVMVQQPGMPPHYGQPGQQPMRMYAPLPNGYQMAVPQGTMNPPGILRYAPPTYPQMLRPAYPQRPPGAVGVIPTLQRPPIMIMRGPVVPTIVRPPINLALAQTEKPMTTIYVGKIASTVDNDFMLSLLQLCGPVKSWKRVPDPTTGALKGFGFCEFESVEGVLRALRLLSKLSIDGQELMLNFDKATKEYLKRFVEKKKENLKSLKATDTEGAGKEDKTTSSKSSVDESKEDDNNNTNNEANKEIDDYASFGLVTDEDKETDKEASEKLSGMIEERIKNKPLPPPPPPPQTAPDVGGNSTSDHPAKSRDGGDSDADVARSEDKKDEEKPTNVTDRLETSSPDRNSKKERERAREKERELERYEREREQERAKREREREYKIREEERRYRARLKEWEIREKEKERARKQEREREKDKEQDRKYEIIDQENDDSYSKKRKYRNSGEEREERKRRLREKEEDEDDKIKEMEEIAEAKKKEEEEREKLKEQQKHALEILSTNNNNNNTANGIENAMHVDGSVLEIRNKGVDHQSTDVEMEHGNEIGNKITQNGTNDDSETRQSNTLGPKKLGFGLVGSGKRTTVPSLFHEEDEDAQKDKKMRPLVPIDYSTEELQAVRETTPVPPSNLAAAAEFAKRIGDRPDSDRDRSRRGHDRHRDRDHETSRARDEKEKVKTPDNKKLLDAKQLIDTIPKTKDELFSYPINWVVYDKNGLPERMRPWISKKITEFLGEEETTLVDYIVSSTQEHVTAHEMFDRLQSILDDEAEMFVLKMWRMLIFEVKKVEAGLTARSKA